MQTIGTLIFCAFIAYAFMFIYIRIKKEKLFFPSLYYFFVFILYLYILSLLLDGQAASAAGMKSIGVTWGSHSMETIVPHFSTVVATTNELELEIGNFLSSLKM